VYLNLFCVCNIKDWQVRYTNLFNRLQFYKIYLIDKWGILICLIDYLLMIFIEKMYQNTATLSLTGVWKHKKYYFHELFYNSSYKLIHIRTQIKI
jgi:hypothetical protein